VLLCIAWNIQQIHATKRKTKFSFQWTFKEDFLQPFLRYKQSNFWKNFFVFFFFFNFFCTLCKNYYNSCMHASIWLIFGTHIRGLKENTSIKIEVNLINIQGVTSGCMNKVKPNFCHAYKVNHFKEQTENWNVARLNIRGVPLGS